MTLSKSVYDHYQTIVSELKSSHRNIDPYLLIKSAMLSSKYPKEPKQKFWLEIHFRHGTDDAQNRDAIYGATGCFPSSHGSNHFVIDLQVNLETVLSIAENRDIERIEGTVYPLS